MNFKIKVLLIVLHLGSICQSLELNSTFGVSMQRVENFEAIIISRNKTILTWNVEHLDKIYPANYEVSIIHRSSCDLTWRTMNIKDQIYRVGNGTYFIYDLEILCPNKRHAVTLWTKSMSENITIPNITTTFTGAPSEPFVIPNVNVGSFFIDKNDDVHIYWKCIDPTSYNSDNFTIMISNELDNLNHQLNNTITEKIDLNRSTTTLKKDWFNSSLGAKVKLQAYNNIGFASGASFIEIPPKDHLCGKPENIQVYVLNKTYHVSWTRPSDHSEIVSYTVFYCASVSDRLNNCDSPIDFKTVTEDLKFNITTSNYLKFAISANTDSSTSGMTWMECFTETDATQIGRIDSMSKIVNISTNQIELEWIPKCKDKLTVKNYTVSYCEVDSKLNNNCIATETSIITNATSYDFKELKSDTFYQFTIQMHSETTNGLKSVPQYIKTHTTFWKIHLQIITGILLITTVIVLIVLCFLLRKLRFLISWHTLKVEDTESQV